MAAPKGTKLASGYRDRARDRDETDGDDREDRIKALEEQMKLGQIEREVFEQLRDNITGGDIGATHLVKGLDRQLLERVRRGEDVLSAEKYEENEEKEQRPDADEELEQLEEREITTVEKEKTVKKGIMAPPPLPVAGVKRSRNDILAELKASRRAAAEAKAAAQPQLGSKFKKVGTKKPTSKIEIDDRGREVLITVDENGNVKRKVRKVVNELASSALPMPDKAVKPLGMTVPDAAMSARVATPEDLDDDIFEGVGDAYNPLGNSEQDDTSSSEDEATAERPKATESKEEETSKNSTSRDSQSKSPSPSRTAFPTASSVPDTAPAPATRRNYFNDNPTISEDTTNRAAHLTDPTFLATLSKAAAIAERTAASETAAEAATAPQSTIAQRLLARQDRDFEDMDMGFGGSRFDDAEEMDEGGAKIKLSRWKGLVGGEDEDDEDDGEGKRKGQGGGKKKSGKGGKKNGDKNSAAAVLKVIEGRKAK